MNRLNQDIKNKSFKNVYLLCGTEDYLRNQFRTSLKDALLDGADEMTNFSAFEGKDVRPEAIVDTAETLPFLAERRVILVENTGFFKNSSGELLVDYLKAFPETTFFIFCETEIDKRNRLFKAVRDVGYVAEFSTMDEGTLKNWINKKVAQENMTIDGAAVALLLYKTGTDMENISSELEKCICYCLKRGYITTADVEEICIEQLTNRIFDMINYMATGQREKALKLYYDLLSLKEPPMRILFLMSKQFNALYQTHIYGQKRYNQKMIAERLGVAPFIAEKYYNQAKLFTQKTLRQALEECVQTEQDIKTGRVSDVMGVELLLIKYSAATKK